MSKRALRRHHYRRLKRTLLRRMTAAWGHEWLEQPRHLGMWVATRPRCSRPWCCGNPRGMGSRTRQEYKAELKQREGIAEWEQANPPSLPRPSRRYRDWWS